LILSSVCLRLVVDNRREEVDRLDDSQVVGELKDAGVLRPFHARDDIGVGLERESRQRFREVARTYLTSSTRAVDGLGETQLFLIRHIHLSRILYYDKLKG
jgi:hypothetical protein